MAKEKVKAPWRQKKKEKKAQLQSKDKFKEWYKALTHTTCTGARVNTLLMSQSVPQSVSLPVSVFFFLPLSLSSSCLYLPIFLCVSARGSVCPCLALPNVISMPLREDLLALPRAPSWSNLFQKIESFFAELICQFCTDKVVAAWCWVQEDRQSPYGM